jgi:hypothetical protein
MRTKSRSLPRVWVLLVAAVLSVGAGLVVASPANAATQASGNCDPFAGGPMCYYFRSSYGGSRAAINFDVNDLYAYTFSNQPNTDGWQKPVANHAGSGWNRDTGCIAQIWEHVLNPASGRGRLLELNWYGFVGQNNATLGLLNNNNRSQSWRC